MLFIFLGLALAAPLSPDDAVAAALASHADLAVVAGEHVSAAGAARSSAFLRENPQLEFSYALVGDRVSLSAWQPLSLSAEGIADHRSAVARRAAAELGVARAELRVAADVRTAYVHAIVATSAATVAGQGFALASRQLLATEAALGVGNASDLDVRLARLQHAKSARDVLVATANEATALTALSVMARRPVLAESLVIDPRQAVPEPTVVTTNGERADVRQARLVVQAAEAALSRERSAVVPALSLGGFYESERGTAVVGPTVGLTLPLWQHNQAGVSAARADLAVAHAALDATTSLADAEQRASHQSYIAAVTVMTAVPATVSDAKAALASVDAGVRSGDFDLVTTILLRDEILAGQQALTEALGELSLSRIRLLLATEDEALLGARSR